MSKVKPFLYMLGKGGISVLQTAIFNFSLEYISLVVKSFKNVKPFTSVYIAQLLISQHNNCTGKPVLTDTRDRRTLAHNGQILIERNFSFIKSLK